MTADECVFQDGCCGLPPGDYSRRLMLNRKAYWDPGRTNVMSAPSLSGEAVRRCVRVSIVSRGGTVGVALTGWYN